MPSPRYRYPRINVGLRYVEDHWLAFSSGAGSEGTGATPSEAVADLIKNDGFDAGVLGWWAHLCEAQEREKQERIQREEEKKERARLGRIRRRTKNITSIDAPRATPRASQPRSAPRDEHHVAPLVPLGR